MSLLELTGISKSFGNVIALQNVDLSVNQAEIHALIGENGAGKSTLMKVLSGAYHPDNGQMTFKGMPYSVKTPSAARQAGVAMIYQELTLAPHLSVAENMVLGIEDRTLGFMTINKAKVRSTLAMLGHEDIPLKMPVAELSIGLKQVVEIARAIYSNSEVIIMDEPTSSLAAADTQALFRVIHKLKERGISIIYISHFLEEVQEIADRFTVLRDGCSVATGAICDTSLSQLVEHMVGRSITELYPQVNHPIGEPVLTVSGLCGSPYPDNVSFSLRKGEILGIAGLVGSGRTEMLRCMFGLDKLKSGTITLQGGASTTRHRPKPKLSLVNGIDMLSENRKEEGLGVTMSIKDNLTLSSLQKHARFSLLKLKEEQDDAERSCRALKVKCQNVLQQVSELSGGNQQKIAIARLLYHQSDILLMDEPTRGIDVGSKSEIYQLILQLAKEGRSIVFVSSYLPELLGVCDTLAVMHKGCLSPVYPVSEWTETDIMHFATSGTLKPPTEQESSA